MEGRIKPYSILKGKKKRTKVRWRRKRKNRKEKYEKKRKEKKVR